MSSAESGCSTCWVYIKRMLSYWLYIKGERKGTHIRDYNAVIEIVIILTVEVKNILTFQGMNTPPYSLCYSIPQFIRSGQGHKEQGARGNDGWCHKPQGQTQKWMTIRLPFKIHRRSRHPFWIPSTFAEGRGRQRLECCLSEVLMMHYKFCPRFNDNSVLVKRWCW